MNTDRELLEKAAKAAGHTGIISFAGYVGVMVPCNPEGTSKFQRWNALADDADAFRLAVKLGIYFSVVAEQGCVVARIRNGVRSVWTEHIGNDANAATRRAIVRAAAAIGEQMP